MIWIVMKELLVRSIGLVQSLNLCSYFDSCTIYGIILAGMGLASTTRLCVRNICARSEGQEEWLPVKTLPAANVLSWGSWL
jgi:hypothetical protein